MGTIYTRMHQLYYTECIRYPRYKGIYGTVLRGVVLLCILIDTQIQIWTLAKTYTLYMCLVDMPSVARNTTRKIVTYN
jgi:hypothetical protein